MKNSISTQSMILAHIIHKQNTGASFGVCLKRSWALLKSLSVNYKAELLAGQVSFKYVNGMLLSVIQKQVKASILDNLDDAFDSIGRAIGLTGVYLVTVLFVAMFMLVAKELGGLDINIFFSWFVGAVLVVSFNDLVKD